MPHDTRTDGGELVDWTLAPFLTPEQRLSIAQKAVRRFSAFGPPGAMTPIDADPRYFGVDRYDEFAGYLAKTTPVDKRAYFEDQVRSFPSKAGAVVNVVLRQLAADRAKLGAAASVVRSTAPVIMVSPSGQLVVAKPKPNIATFAWGAIFSR